MSTECNKDIDEITSLGEYITELNLDDSKPYDVPPRCFSNIVESSQNDTFLLPRPATTGWNDYDTRRTDWSMCCTSPPPGLGSPSIWDSNNVDWCQRKSPTEPVQFNSLGCRPLRSQRVDVRILYAMMYRAMVNNIAGGRREVCVFCRNNGEHELIYTSHSLKDNRNKVTCPILRAYQCPICLATGDKAHTIKYCPYNAESASGQQDTPLEKLFRYVHQQTIQPSVFYPIPEQQDSMTNILVSHLLNNPTLQSETPNLNRNGGGGAGTLFASTLMNNNRVFR